eukprot:2491420-Pleurochrysis_carterae.AAC.1
MSTLRRWSVQNTPRSCSPVVSPSEGTRPWSHCSFADVFPLEPQITPSPSHNPKRPAVARPRVTHAA